MRHTPLIMLAGLLVAGCASQKPLLPSGGSNQPSPAPASQSNSLSGANKSQHKKPFGQTKPLKREQIQSSGSRIGSNTGAKKSSQRQPPPKSIKKNASPAVMSLVNSADQAMKQHQTDRAGSLIERALNLAPRNPFLYQKLAAIRLTQKQPAQAVQLARKSNSLAGNNPFIKQTNWQLIAQADKNRGHKSAVRQAVLRANKYKRIANQY